MKLYNVIKEEYNGETKNYGDCTIEDVKAIIPKTYKPDEMFSTDTEKYYFSQKANVCYIVREK